MNNKCRSVLKVLLQLGLVVVVTAAAAMPAQAFEERELKNGYRIIVGFSHEDEEPPVAGVPTGLTVYAGHDVPGTSDTEVLDRRLGDKVELLSVALRLDAEDFHANIKEIIPMLKPFKLVPDEDIDPGYEQAFTPKVAGPYGFIITGTLKKKGYPSTTFVQKFVCGHGSLDPVESMSCVAAP